MVAIYLPMVAIGGAVTQNLAPYAAARGMGEQSAGILIAALSFAHLVSTLGLGLLADRFGVRLPMAFLCLTVAAGTVVLAWSHSLPMAMAGAALVGVSSGMITPVAAGIAAEFGSAGFGRAFGLLMLFLPLQTPVAPLFARMEEVTGSYVPALMIFTAVLLLCAMLSLLLRVPRGGEVALIPDPAFAQ
jgi:MFS family permease